MRRVLSEDSEKRERALFQFLRYVAAGDLFLRQLPVFLVSLLIADRWYKFHSFLLETGAFLVTWFAIDALVQGAVMLRNRLARRQSTA